MSDITQAKEQKQKRRSGAFLRFAPIVAALVGAAVIALIAVVLINSLNPHTPTAAPTATPTESASTPRPVTTSDISGSSTEFITGTSTVRMSATALVKLSPGISSPLNLSFANIGTNGVSLSRLAVSIVSVTAPQAGPTSTCSTNDFFVTQMAKTFAVTLNPDATSTLTSLNTPQSGWPTVGMVNANANQDGCKGATLLMSYTATGVTQ